MSTAVKVIWMGFFVLPILASQFSFDNSSTTEEKYFLSLNVDSLHMAKGPVLSFPPSPSSSFHETPPNMRHDLSSLPMIMNADRVSKLLRNFANEEMAVYYMQSLFDSMQYHVDKPDPAEMVSSIVTSLSRKIDAYKRAVEASRAELVSLFQKSPYDMHIFRQYRECCSLDLQYLSPSHFYNVKVNLSISCDVVPAGLSAFSFYPGSRLADVFAANMNKNNAIRWQHFTSSEGMRFEYPAHRMDERSYQNCQVIAERRRRQLFMSAMFSYRKQAVIILDKGSGMSETQFSSAKCVAHVLLECFRPDDEILVVGVSDHLLRSSVCSDVTVPLNAETMESFHSFINLLSRDPEPVNHTLVFEIAFKILRNRPMKGAGEGSYPFECRSPSREEVNDECISLKLEGDIEPFCYQL
ncbi:unnamed protein product [Soboliphyme baturini]|uniref:VWA_N domain-containing protein n=1 Tax=Soboliphyme baturini TaxID=241478 RepID=A0A183J5M0_9BILA|nr:unnamed protein product [Soboliphyme baturini]